MKRENKMGRKAVDFGVPVLIATILIFSSVIIIAADERGPAAYIVDGYAVYCNGGNADGATVLLTPSSGSSVTTTVGPAGGWPTGYWQINVGSIGGPGWEYGTTFSVLITTSGWSGSQSGFTIVDDGNYHTYTGTTTLNPTTSVVATAGAYPTTIVEGESVDFTGSATGGTGVYTWYWDFDGDGTSAEQNPSHTFNDEGTYVCTLTATDECSNSDDDTVTITVNPALSCDAGGPYSGDVCDPVSFTGSASGGYSPYTYDWDFGDGSSHSSQQNPTHQYVNDGSYTATLTVTDSNTNTDTDTAPVTISTDPLVADAGGPYSGTMCDPVSFTGSASGGCDPYTYDWDFGDGSSHSSQQNPTHQYVNDGSYTATLTVTDSNTNTDTDTAPVTISTDPLVADAGGPYSGTMCDPISFTGSASGGCDPYTYDWDFGDGSSHSSQQNPTHQYVNDGSYTATLTVTDSNTNTDTDTAPVTISTDPLVADAGGPYSGTMCDPVSFTGSASGGCDPYTYDWDFGDGSSGSGPYPSHQYDNDGTYTATLTVTDDVGLTDQDTAQVTISTTPLSVDADGPYSGNEDDSIDFYGSASGGCMPYNWEWDFGDGGSSSEQNPTHTYDDPGTYTVTLTVTDDVGAIETDTTTADIAIAEVIADADGPYYGAIDEPIQFYGSASSGVPPYTYNWNFGDGSTGAGQNPTHTYDAPNTDEGYEVILYVTDSESNHDWDRTTAFVASSSGKPSANAHGPYNGIIDMEIQFTGSAFGGTKPYNWEWDFGDGSTSTEQNPAHAYSEEGTYDVSLTVTDDNSKIDTDTATATITIGNPDLTCQGILSWSGVKSNSSVSGSFTVLNNGNPGTLLDWEIVSYPNWGTWTFDPESGDGLTPEEGSVTVEVSVVAPKAKSKSILPLQSSSEEYSGSVVVQNSENPSDTCEIPVSMVVPHTHNSNPLMQFLWWLVEQFPILELFLGIR